jgi:hypothetical protein
VIWVKVGELDKMYPISDEDMDRSNDDKTSAVHFMRYQLSDAQVQAAKTGEAISFGVDHVAYPCEELVLNENQRLSLVADLR